MTTPSARYPGRPRTAVAVLVVAALPALGGAVLQLASRLPLTPDVLFLVVDVLVGLIYGCVASVILWRRSHPVAWLIALAGIGGGLAALGGGWASFAMTHPVPAGAIGIGLFGSAWVPGTLALFLVVPWLIRESPLTPLAWAGLAAGVAVTLTLTIQRVAFPVTDNGMILLAVVLVGLVTAAGVVWRRRYGPVGERPGLGLLAAGTALMALSFLPLVLVPYTSAGLVLLVPVSHLACQALFPGALLVTVLRNRLWGIDLAVSRAVLAGLLTLGMAAVYAALVWAASWMVGSSVVAQVIAAVGVVLAVQPIRSWLEKRVRRLVWGEASSPGRAALRIGASLSTVHDARALDQLAAAVGDALRLESVTLSLIDDRNTAGRWGTATSPPLELAVHEHDDGAQTVAGMLAVTPRPGELLDRRTRESLDRLQPILAAGLGLVRASRQVARARDAATSARLAERRLIRRELHDGMGPWLSGLQLGLQGARNVMHADPVAADAVLVALQEEAAQRVQDVRLLSRSLLPPALEEQGLGVAVRELAARHAEAGFVLELEGLLLEDPELLRALDPRVAAVAYAVLSESALNAARHSGADRCLLEVTHDQGTGLLGDSEALVVTCSDSGTGRAVEARDGVGTASMRERVQELGGTFEIAPALEGSGVLVRARLPLQPMAVLP